MQTASLNSRRRPMPRSKASRNPIVSRYVSDLFSRLSKIARPVGLIMVALSIVGGFLVNPAVGIGLAILAGIRLWILRREEKRLAQEPVIEERVVTASAPRKRSRQKGK